MKTLKSQLIVILIIIIFTLSSCSSLVNPKEEKFKDVVYEEYEALIDAFLEVSKVQDISDYIFSWGNSQGFLTKKDGSGTVIIVNDSDNLKQEPMIHLSCDFTISNRVKDFEKVAFLMGVLKDTYDEKVIEVSFVPYKYQDYFGARNISQTYLNRGTFIHLNTITPNEVILEENSIYEGKISRTMKQVKPTCNLGYTLTVSGMPSVYTQEIDKSTVNVAKELGMFFSNLRTEGVIFDLYEMDIDQMVKEDGYFSYVNGTVKFLITQNDIKNLNKTFQKFNQSIIKDNIQYNPEISVALIENEEVPDKVISHKDKDDILNFLYTVFTGVSTIDEEEIASVITYVTLNSNEFLLDLRLSSSIDLDKEVLLENVKAASVLSEMNQEYKLRRTGFQQDPLVDWIKVFLSKASVIAPSQSGDSPLSTYKKRSNNMNLVSYGISLKDVEKEWNTLHSIFQEL